MGRVRGERVGMAVGDQARRLHRVLELHAERQVIQERLQVRLDLGVAAGGAERHDPAPRRLDEAGVGGEAGAFARGDAGRVAVHRP